MDAKYFNFGYVRQIFSVRHKKRERVFIALACNKLCLSFASDEQIVKSLLQPGKFRLFLTYGVFVLSISVLYHDQQPPDLDQKVTRIMQLHTESNRQ